MLSRFNPFYDPYPFPFLSFLHVPKNVSLQNDLHMNQNNDFFEKPVCIISHLELHTQTEDPIITLGICFPVWFFFTVTAIFIQIRTLDMLKQESSVNNKLMVTQAKLHIVFWPTMMIMIELIGVDEAFNKYISTQIYPSLPIKSDQIYIYSYISHYYLKVTKYISNHIYIYISLPTQK